MNVSIVLTSVPKVVLREVVLGDVLHALLAVPSGAVLVRRDDRFLKDFMRMPRENMRVWYEY